VCVLEVRSLEKKRKKERERRIERERERGRGVEGEEGEREVSFLDGLSLNPKRVSRTQKECHEQARTHARTHTRMPARTHARTHARTPIISVSLSRTTLRSEQLLCHPFLKRAAAKDVLAALVAKHKGLEALSAESRCTTSSLATSPLAATPSAAAHSGIVGAAGPAGDVRVSSAYQRARPNEEHV
jgi:hypothetical protein